MQYGGNAKYIFFFSGHGCELDQTILIPENIQYVIKEECGMLSDLGRDNFFSNLLDYMYVFPEIVLDPKNNINKLKTRLKTDIKVHYHINSEDSEKIPYQIQEIIRTCQNSSYIALARLKNINEECIYYPSGLRMIDSRQLYEEDYLNSVNIFDPDKAIIKTKSEYLFQSDIEYIYNLSIYPTIKDLKEKFTTYTKTKKLKFNIDYGIDEKKELWIDQEVFNDYIIETFTNTLETYFGFLEDYISGENTEIIFYNMLCRPSCEANPDEYYQDNYLSNPTKTGLGFLNETLELRRNASHNASKYIDLSEALDELKIYEKSITPEVLKSEKFKKMFARSQDQALSTVQTEEQSKDIL